MASISERNGKFHVRVYRKEGAVCKSFHLKKDAQSWARKTESDIQSGRWSSKSKQPELTLRGALTRYADQVSIHKKGCHQETYLIEAIKRENLTTKALSSLQGADIALLRDKWRHEGLAAATVRRRLAIISHCFEIARKEWSVEVANPVLLIRKPVVANGRDRRLLDGELAEVLIASESSELEIVALLAIETAMRLSEIVSLRRRDVDIVGRTVELRDTKNGATRVVPLSPVAIELFETLLKSERMQLFLLASSSVSRAWTRAVRKARRTYEIRCMAAGSKPRPDYLIDLHFHDLRHEATSRLFEMGIFNPMEVAAITGHKTLQMLSRYAHMSVTRLAQKIHDRYSKTN